MPTPLPSQHARPIRPLPRGYVEAYRRGLDAQPDVTAQYTKIQLVTSGDRAGVHDDPGELETDYGMLSARPVFRPASQETPELARERHTAVLARLAFWRSVVWLLFGIMCLLIVATAGALVVGALYGLWTLPLGGSR